MMNVGEVAVRTRYEPLVESSSPNGLRDAACTVIVILSFADRERDHHARKECLWGSTPPLLNVMRYVPGIGRVAVDEHALRKPPVGVGPAGAVVTTPFGCLARDLERDGDARGRPAAGSVEDMRL